MRSGSQARPAEPPRESGVRVGPLAITPTGVLLLIALIGSVAYFLFALTVREASQIPLEQFEPESSASRTLVDGD